MATDHSMRLRSVLDSNRAEMNEIFASYGAFDVKLFGSVARGTASPGSDIDLMVSIDGPDYEQFMSMLGLGVELSELLGTSVEVAARGVALDAVTESSARDFVDV